MTPARSCLLASLLAIASGCDSRPSETADPLAAFRLVDLSHAFDETTVFWPTGQPFQHTRTAWGQQPGGFWYSSYDLAMSEHSGTHLDAPIHFAEGKATVGAIPLEDLTGPLAVVDIEDQCETDPDYAVTADDLNAFEDLYGPVSAGTIVLFRTGWSRRWPNTRSYLGDDTPGRADSLHFPGISPGAARWLVEHGVALTGIDTASIDPGPSQDFAAHQVLAEGSIPILENVASLAEVPPRGAYLLAFPMKISIGSGAPCRIAALVPAA